MLYSAKVAEENNIEVLTMGKQLVGPMIKENEQRWRNLIAKVRAVYHGKLAQAPFNNQHTMLHEDMTWADDLDYVIVYYYNAVSEKESPSLEELKEAMEKFNTEQFDPIYEKYQTPIIMLLPFQSRDYAAKQEWFEPMASAPNVKQDLVAQAELYEAFFETTIDEPWLAGVMTWGYWTNEPLDLPSSFEKSSTLRDKPASLVIRKWFSQIED